jgi:hypothetical protein
MVRATSLTDPISGSNITYRFNSIVISSVNAGITFGTNNKPFSEAPNSFFGGTTSGYNDLTSVLPVGNEINATELIDTMVILTQAFTNVRNAQFKLNLTSSGSAPYNVSQGPRTGSPGIIENVTGKSILSGGYIQSGVISIDSGGVSEGLLITKTSINSDLLAACKDEYISAAGNTAIMPTVNVCHASCHSSCHNSRSRR